MSHPARTEDQTMVTLSDFHYAIIYMYDHIPILVSTSTFKADCLFYKYSQFVNNRIKTFNSHEDSLIKEIVYEFFFCFGELFFQASLFSVGCWKA